MSDAEDELVNVKHSKRDKRERDGGEPARERRHGRRGRESRGERDNAASENAAGAVLPDRPNKIASAI